MVDIYKMAFLGRVFVPCILFGIVASGSEIHLSVPHTADSGYMILKLGCSSFEFKVQPREGEFYEMFKVTDKGYLEVFSSLENQIGKAFVFSVIQNISCYTNVKANRIFHIHIKNNSETTRFNQRIYMGKLSKFNRFVKMIDDWEKTIKFNTQGTPCIAKYNLIGDQAEMFSISSEGDFIFDTFKMRYLPQFGTLLFVLEVSSSCQANSGFTNLEIVFNFENDQRMEFEYLNSRSSHRVVKRQTNVESVSLSVPENSTGILYKVNSSQPPGSFYNFHIISVLPENIFQISSSGDISIAPRSFLDYDNGPRQYSITIDVFRSTTVLKRIVVIMTVTDINDMLPFFTNFPLPYRTTVRSTFPLATKVYNLTASDMDASANSLRYYVDGQSADFTVDVNTGEIRTKRLFNQAGDVNGTEISLPVYVVDTSADIEQKTNATVFIRIGYAPPQFYASAYKTQIEENNAINALYNTVNAHSLKPLEVGAVNFQSDIGGSTVFSVYEANEKISNDFGIENGHVKALRKFVYATDPHMYNLTIRAQDNSSGLSSDAQLNVLIEKEYRPMFTLSVYTSTIKENVPVNTTVLEARASDGNASVHFNYTLSDEEYFWVDSVQGVGFIKVKKTLDYDTTGPSHAYTFNISVVNFNNAPTNTTALVVVYLENVNDNTPVFLIQNPVSTITDNIQSDSTVMNVIAVDPDGDTITYAFKGTSGTSTVEDIFAINPNSGRITLRTDSSIPNNKDKYVLTVVAEDTGDCCPNDPSQPRHKREQEITINIVDQKNFKPQFDDCSSYYNASLLEQQPYGTDIVQVSASDKNRGENGEISFYISSYIGDSKDDYFTIDNKTGLVKSGNKVFDREAIGSNIVRVTVRAQDNGQPPLADECTFIVNIIDINDNAPLFMPQLVVPKLTNGYIMASASVGDVVVNVRANDDDAGKNAEIEYTLENNEDNLFKIDPDSGVISVNKSLNNINGSITITAVATDKGSPALNSSTEVSIHIVENTDEIPALWEINNPDWQVEDNLRNGDLIKSISFGSNINSMTFITPYGDATLNMMNVILRGASNKLYNVQATAEFQRSSHVQTIQLRLYNNTKPGTTLWRDSYCRITLTDTNNEEPIFINRISADLGKIELSVTENQTAGQIVGTLLAFDADTTPPYNTVRYRLLRGDGKFQINPVTGTLTTNEVFDREDNPDVRFNIQVEAYDGANSSIANVDGPNTATAAISIKVEDINDWPPYFTRTRYSFDVTERAPILFIVGKITAMDKDAPSTSNYTKYILEGSPLFSANDTSGEIIVTGLLIGQANKVFNLTFIADDGIYATPVPVSITVLKSFNKRPTFSGNYDIRDIVGNRNYSSSETVFQIKADDPDCSGVCRLDYSILSFDAEVNRIFEIGRYSGNVTLTDILNTDRSYVFTVMVKDQSPTRRAMTPETAYTTVSVQPANCNKHQLATESGQCYCKDYCANTPCRNDQARCVNNCTNSNPYGFTCICPAGYSGVFCDIMEPAATQLPYTPSPRDNTWLIILLICIAVVIIAVILAIAFIYMRRRRGPEESKFAYDNEDYDIREDVMDYDDDGAGEEDHAGYDISIISKPSESAHPDKPDFRSRETVQPVQSTPIGGHQLSSFIFDRLHDTDSDPHAPPFDTLREYDFEGAGSSAGSLSSINTASSDGSQDYQYLYDCSPKLAKLADLYNQYEDSD